MGFARLSVVVVLLACTADAGAGQPAKAADRDPDAENAEKHFARGKQFYGANQYKKALAEFEAARRLKPMPELEFNVARCHDRLGHARDAITNYQRYLALKPAASDAAEIKERIRVLNQRLSASEPLVPGVPSSTAPAPAPATVAPAPPSGAARPADDRPFARRHLVPIVIGGAALVLALTATALVATVPGDYDALASGCLRPCRQVDALEMRANAGYALFALAGAAAVTDAILWGLQLRRPRTAVQAWAAPGAAGLVVGGRF